ncbi:MAG: HAD family hydrolase [Rhizobacter sp.]|nr:HAD family hydrolase [Chlorobiales bacterium]
MRTTKAILFSLDALTKAKSERDRVDERIPELSVTQFPKLLHRLSLTDIQHLLQSIIIAFNACIDQSIRYQFTSPSLTEIIERALKITLRREAKPEEVSEVLQCFSDDSPIEFSKRMIMYLDILQRSGYIMGIVANLPLPLTAVMERFESASIMKYFWTIVLSSDYGVLKPSDTLFKSAIESLQCQEHEVIIVGSNLERDLLPLQNMASQKIYFNSRKKLEAPPEGVIAVSSLDELRTIL